MVPETGIEEAEALGVFDRRSRSDTHDIAREVPAEGYPGGKEYASRVWGRKSGEMHRQWRSFA